MVRYKDAIGHLIGHITDQIFELTPFQWAGIRLEIVEHGDLHVYVMHLPHGQVEYPPGVNGAVCPAYVIFILTTAFRALHGMGTRAIAVTRSVYSEITTITVFLMHIRFL